MAPSTDRTLLKVSESIWVDRPREIVFDFTSDFSRRTEWDGAVSEVTILGTSPRSARLTVPGIGRTNVVMRQDRRPERTSAAFQDIESRWIIGGGGSWQYEPERGGTRWTETNTLELRASWPLKVLAPILTWNFRRATRRAMAEAKRQLERSSP